MILLVSYKLTPNRDYSALYNTLKSAPSTSWWHFIDDLWLLQTDETPQQLNDRLVPHMNKGVDTMLITSVDLANYYGWLPKEAHDWIKEKRPRSSDTSIDIS